MSDDIKSGCKSHPGESDLLDGGSFLCTITRNNFNQLYKWINRWSVVKGEVSQAEIWTFRTKMLLSSRVSRCIIKLLDNVERRLPTDVHTWLIEWDSDRFAYERIIRVGLHCTHTTFTINCFWSADSQSMSFIRENWRSAIGHLYIYCYL